MLLIVGDVCGGSGSVHLVVNIVNAGVTVDEAGYETKRCLC